MTTLVSIGYLGSKRVYINIPREEAIRRWEASEGESVDKWLNNIDVYEFEGDEFWAYDVGGPLDG